MQRFIRGALTVALSLAPAAVAHPEGLAGSPSSMVHQHQVAVKEDYSFLRSAKEVNALATKGALVPVTESANLALSKVSYPFARPEVRDFVERFAASYREATGSRLVVTSLTRPTSSQPANAHKLSVHPAGMAVDLRVPPGADDRAFLESSLLAMEKAGVLDVTRERSPAHYHVAVFAEGFARYAAQQDSIAAVAAAAKAHADSVARVARAALAAAAPSDSGSSAPIGLGLALLIGVAGTVAVGTKRTRAA